MKYFKRKDGSVFGKVDSISKNVIDGFIKKGYKECDEDGKVIIKKKKEKSKCNLNKSKISKQVKEL